MKHTVMLTGLMAVLGMPVAAEIVVKDAYARSSNAMAGAAFMAIENTGPEDDRLIGAASDAAQRVELHTHRDMGGGVMKMLHVEEGFALPAGETHMLMRGGDHVMLMGLNGAMEQGDTVTVTLTFEKAGEQVVEIPVDLERKPDHSGHGGHAGH
ncbi:copper chaperone PCu(A)C [Ponticoccus alexandrii]|uniref:Copper chaperone PCu(A)C n=1 Tax=Ponticoccus alexandrii TaxID=1943633 RepID=A0ABX7FCZ7_9RHOB|nr:copper chaperone PCu(A)C [Ponticoccus alexandrii]ETA50969.2 copper-binding protein [Rhodobacteraceae bacterium PD-2]QRF67449.1 copper chaperone PCu(A)C [Ponticoccus alexandrii]